MRISRHNELGKGTRRAGRLLLKPIEKVVGLVLRTILASCVFYVSLAVVLHSLGYPVPRISDVGRYLEGLTELSKILS